MSEPFKPLYGEKLAPHLREERNMVNEGLHKTLSSCKPVSIHM